MCNLFKLVYQLFLNRDFMEHLIGNAIKGFLTSRNRFFFHLIFSETPADQQDRKPVNACDDQDGNGKK